MIFPQTADAKAHHLLIIIKRASFVQYFSINNIQFPNPPEAPIESLLIVSLLWENQQFIRDSDRASEEPFEKPDRLWTEPE